MPIVIKFTKIIKPDAYLQPDWEESRQWTKIDPIQGLQIFLWKLPQKVSQQHEGKG